MHTRKSAVFFAAAWIVAIALMPATNNTFAGGGESALGLSGITLVVGQLPEAAPLEEIQP